MKKLIVTLLCFTLLFGVGCSNSKKEDYDSYIGTWRNGDSSIPDDELIIKSIEDDEITFDYIVYRTASFEDEVATIEDGIASFDINDSIKGTIKLKDDKVTFTIKESSNELISNGSTVYKKKYDKSILSGE